MNVCDWVNETCSRKPFEYLVEQKSAISVKVHLLFTTSKLVYALKYKL